MVPCTPAWRLSNTTTRQVEVTEVEVVEVEVSNRYVSLFVPTWGSGFSQVLELIAKTVRLLTDRGNTAPGGLDHGDLVAG